MSIEIRDSKDVLNDLYGTALADRAKTATISENTRAALYVKGKVKDMVDVLYKLHELLYGFVDDDSLNEFCEATEKIDELAYRYIMASINDNIGFRDCTQI